MLNKAAYFEFLDNGSTSPVVLNKAAYFEFLDNGSTTTRRRMVGGWSNSK